MGDFWSVIKGFHPLPEHIDEPVQKLGPSGLPRANLDKGVVVVAQVYIVEMLEMGRQFLDVRGPTVDAFGGLEGIEELDQVSLAPSPEKF